MEDFLDFKDYKGYAKTWVDEILVNDSHFSGDGFGTFFLEKMDYTIRGGYDYKNIIIRGRMEFDREIVQIGYIIDHLDMEIREDFSDETTEADKCCGKVFGDNAVSFKIEIPTAQLAPGSYAIELAAQLKNGYWVVLNGAPSEDNAISTITFKCIEKPQMTPMGEKICREAKWVADCCRENDFLYGDAPINPAINNDAKKCSCDRLCEWTLYRAGYTDQPERQGLVVWAPGANDLSEWCERQGFLKIENYDDLQPGDVVFVNYNLPRPEHAYVFAGWAGDKKCGQIVRYDAGSTERMHTYQPFVQSIIVRPGRVENFLHAYRAVEKEIL